MGTKASVKRVYMSPRNFHLLFRRIREKIFKAVNKFTNISILFSDEEYFLRS